MPHSARQNKNEWTTLGIWIVFALALCVRFWWITRVHPIPHSDFAWYHDEAISILQGRGYEYAGHPTAYFPIGYPLVLAAVYKLFGIHFASGVVVNIVLNAATASLVYAFSYRLFGRLFGLLSGLLMALYLPHIEWSSVLCSEILFTFLFFLTSYLLILKSARDTNVWLVMAAGVTLGLASIVRPVTLFLPGAILLYYLLCRVGIWRSLRNTAIVLLAMVVTISPVTIRNYRHFHELVSVSTNGGVNLWQGNNPHANGAYYWPMDTRDNPFLNYVDNEVEDNKLATKMAMDFIKTHPYETIQLGFEKWGHLFQGVDNAQVWSIGHSVPPVSKAFAATSYRVSLCNYRIVLYLALVGFLAQLMWLRARRDTRVVLLWLMLLYYIALFFIFPAWDRMRVPMEPWLIVLAGFALAAIPQAHKYLHKAGKVQAKD